MNDVFFVKIRKCIGHLVNIIGCSGIAEFPFLSQEFVEFALSCEFKN
jgi:hypothetical protein